MLGFDALGRLPLGGYPGGGAASFNATLTAGASVSGVKRKLVAPALKTVGLSVAASLLSPVNRVKMFLVGMNVSAVATRTAGKPQQAYLTVGAHRRPVALNSYKTANVQILGVVRKALLRIPMTVQLSAGAALLKNAAKPFRVAVSVFAQMIEFAGNIVSRRVLPDPVDYFMEGLPQYRESHRTVEHSRGKASESVKLSAGPRGRIGGKAPSFTTRTDKRGYD